MTLIQELPMQLVKEKPIPKNGFEFNNEIENLFFTVNAVTCRR